MAAAIFNSSPIEKKFAILLLASFVTIWQKMEKFGEGRGVWSTLIYIYIYIYIYRPKRDTIFIMKSFTFVINIILISGSEKWPLSRTISALNTAKRNPKKEMMDVIFFTIPI